MDTQRNVTIDHSQEDQCPNTYSTGVLLLLATLKQTDLATSGLSASFNTSVFKEQISKPRYRVVQREANIKVIEPFRFAFYFRSVVVVLFVSEIV